MLRGRRYNREKGDNYSRPGNQCASKREDQNDPRESTADRLATEYRVSPATIKRDGALVELIDAEMLAAFPQDYPALAPKIAGRMEPKYRVKALLAKLAAKEDWDRQTAKHPERTWTIGDDLLATYNKFIICADRIFDGLPKAKDRDSFFRNDIQFLSIPDPVQSFAITERLNKSQTAAVAGFLLDMLQEGRAHVFVAGLGDATNDTSKGVKGPVFFKKRDIPLFSQFGISRHQTLGGHISNRTLARLAPRGEQRPVFLADLRSSPTPKPTTARRARRGSPSGA